MDKIIEVKNLVKKYGNILAVNDVNFHVNEGHFFALLGPNGAGKSTTINVMCTLLSKTSGEISVNGHIVDIDDDLIRNEIGIVFQDSVLDNLLTVKENLLSRASFYGFTKKDALDKINEIAKIVGIDTILDQRYGTLSGGQRRKSDIARALINEPKILILDEPTTGLDPHTRKRVWQTIKHLQENNNVTIFLTTHYMEETYDADYIVIIDKGSVLASGTPEELRLEYSNDILKVMTKEDKRVLEYLDSNNISYKVLQDVINVYVTNSMEGLKILKDIEEYIYEFEMVRGNMDDVFINITGRIIDEEGK